MTKEQIINSEDLFFTKGEVLSFMDDWANQVSAAKDKEIEMLTKQIKAYKTLQKTGDEIRAHQSKLLSEAETVESEREANAILTEEIEKRDKEIAEKDLIIQWVEEGSELWKAEYDNCRAILEKLVDLKVMKDTFGNRIEGYERMKPLAWEAAKKFLEKYQHQ